MIGTDTNLVVRFLTKDIEEQAQKVKALLQKGEALLQKGEILYINETVLTELYWVLTNVYDYPKIEFIHAIDQITNTEGFVFFDDQIINASIADFINSSAGFNDCLIHQMNKARGYKTLTFDKKASKLKRMKLLK